MFLPLDGLRVVDFSQMLAGPAASLRLADLGAEVIKIERPVTGDLARQIYMCDLKLDGDSMLFHSVNRHKRSYAADLKCREDVSRVLELIDHADVMIQNFRPGVMQRLGLDYDSVRKRNPRIIYGSVSGYGTTGPWSDLPGQDLLTQARSGLMWLTGNADDPPIPFGLSVADMYAGAHLVQGILACLLRRVTSGEGGHVEVSLMESIVDLQFEVLTTHLNDGGRLPNRSASANAHAYLAAPYGVYATFDGYLAIAMNPLSRLAEKLDIPGLAEYSNSNDGFAHRDEIKLLIARKVRTRTTAQWVEALVSADVWCAPVMDWQEMLASNGFKSLNMLQPIRCDTGQTMMTTRCPIRIDGQTIVHSDAAPLIGQHNDVINAEMRRAPQPAGRS